MRRSLRATGQKFLVLSQWPSLLDVVAEGLRKDRWEVVQIDGRDRPAARAALVSRFRDDAGVDGMLASVRVGGLGLNLTMARGRRSIRVIDCNGQQQHAD